MKKKYKVIISAIVLLIIIRLALPYVVLFYTNKTLSEMKGYYGHIKDIELSVYRGACIINHIEIKKVEAISKKQNDFLSVQDIHLSIEWWALFRGFLVGELVINSPVLVFTNDIGGDKVNIRELLKKFMPLKVKSFEVKDGAMHYRDNATKPKVNVALNKIHILAVNLTNITNKEIELPSSITAQADVYGGNLDFTMKFNLLAEDPTFDLNAEIRNANLVLFNDFLKAYGGFDVSKGDFSLYAEIAAKKGKFTGYFKPVITDLVVLGLQNKNDSIFTRIWEGLVSLAGDVFRNQKENQLATKIKIEGDFKNAQTSTLDTIWGVLGNAFIKALVPSIDKDININSVKTAAPKDKNTPLDKPAKEK